MGDRQSGSRFIPPRAYTYCRLRSGLGRCTDYEQRRSRRACVHTQICLPMLAVLLTFAFLHDRTVSMWGVAVVLDVRVGGWVCTCVCACTCARVCMTCARAWPIMWRWTCADAVGLSYFFVGLLRGTRYREGTDSSICSTPSWITVQLPAAFDLRRPCSSCVYTVQRSKYPAPP